MPRKAKESLENQVKEKKKVNKKTTVMPSKAVENPTKKSTTKTVKVKNDNKVNKKANTTKKASMASDKVKVSKKETSTKKPVATKVKSAVAKKASTLKKKTTTKKSATVKAEITTVKKVTTSKAKAPAKKTSTSKAKVATAKKTTAKKVPASKTKVATKKAAATKAKATVAKKSSTSKPKKVTTKKIATSKTEKAKPAVTKKAATKKTKTTTAKSKTTVARKTAVKKSNTSKKTSTPITPEYYDLPYHYDQTVVKVLAQTPKTLFVYWDISNNDIENYMNRYGKDFFNNTMPVLRVHNNATGVTFDIDVDDFANGWYIHVDDSMADYSIELLRKQRPFASKIIDNLIYITSSNEIETPNDHILFDENLHTVFFRNVKTGEEYSRDITNLSLLKRIGKIYDIYDLYKRIYKSEDVGELFDLNNPSSGNPTSTFK